MFYFKRVDEMKVVETSLLEEFKFKGSNSIHGTDEKERNEECGSRKENYEI